MKQTVSLLVLRQRNAGSADVLSAQRAQHAPPESYLTHPFGLRVQRTGRTRSQQIDEC
jgi:hypothetical protein